MCRGAVLSSALLRCGKTVGLPCSAAWPSSTCDSYYLNGSDAFRLKMLLWTSEDVAARAAAAAREQAGGEEAAAEELEAAEQLRHLHLDQQQLQPHGDIS